MATKPSMSLEKLYNYLKTGSATLPSGKRQKEDYSLDQIVTYIAASTAHPGVSELATSAETIAVTDSTRAVTPSGLGASLAKLYLVSFTGRNGAGACTATGAAINDVIFAVAGLTDVGIADASFEAVVTVANQIQQSSASDLSLKNYVALIYRPA